jgi:hypothetical protein
MEKAVRNTKRRKAPAAIGSPSIIKLSQPWGESDFALADSFRSCIITHFLMDLDTLRLRLIEKFIGYQLRWMNRTRTKSPRGASDHFPNELFCGDASLYILLRVQQQQKRENLPDRADLRDCGLFGQSPRARSPKTYSAGNHAPTSKEARPPTTTNALCCGHFFKRWLRTLGVHSFFVMKCVTRILLNCLGADRHSAKRRNATLKLLGKAYFGQKFLFHSQKLMTWNGFFLFKRSARAPF